MLNKVFLIGNLGGDPEVKFTKDGVMMVVFRVATNEFVRQNGSFEKITEWHTVCAFGKLAEFCSSKLKKGDRIFVEGKLKTSSFESENKVFRISNIIAKSIKIIPRGITKHVEGGGSMFELEEDIIAESEVLHASGNSGNGNYKPINNSGGIPDSNNSYRNDFFGEEEDNKDDEREDNEFF